MAKTKLKTRKTLMKRVKISKGGKLLKKANRMRHLKRKMDSARKTRKAGVEAQTNKGQIKIVKKLLGKYGKAL